MTVCPYSSGHVCPLRWLPTPKAKLRGRGFIYLITEEQFKHFQGRETNVKGVFEMTEKAIETIRLREPLLYTQLCSMSLNLPEADSVEGVGRVATKGVAERLMKAVEGSPRITNAELLSREHNEIAQRDSTTCCCCQIVGQRRRSWNWYRRGYSGHHTGTTASITGTVTRGCSGQKTGTTASITGTATTTSSSQRSYRPIVLVVIYKDCGSLNECTFRKYRIKFYNSTSDNLKFFEFIVSLLLQNNSVQWWCRQEEQRLELHNYNP